jgi:hypothetical protein
LSLSGVEGGLAAMREFRAGGYRSLPGLAVWWRALQRGAPELARIAKQDPTVREAAVRLLAAVPDILAAPDRQIPESRFDDFSIILKAIEQQSPMLHRGLARRALEVLPTIRGLPFMEAAEQAARIRPTGRMREYRHPPDRVVQKSKKTNKRSVRKPQSC